MKKYKKLLVFLLCCVLISSVLIFSVSAYNVTAFTINYDSVYVSRFNPFAVEQTIDDAQTEFEQGINVYLGNADSFDASYDYYADYYFTSSGGYGTLNIDVTMENSDVYQSIYYDRGGYNINADMIDANNNSILCHSSSARTGIKFNYTGYIPDYFILRVPFRVLLNNEVDTTTFFNITFAPYNGTSDVIANAEDNTNEIISNQEQNAAEIKANQDKNSSDIQANQDKNTDKALYGKDYDNIDDSSVNEYVNSEAKLMDSLTSGFDQVNDWYSGFIGNVSEGNKAALSFISVFMNKFLDIPEFASLFKIALTLGMFAFVVGSILLVTRISKIRSN